MIELSNLCLGFSSKAVVSDVNLRIPEAKWACILGPNGAGKTTLLRCLSRTLPPLQGEVLISNRNLYKDLSAKDTAQLIAVVPQQTYLSFDFSVREFVLMGRIPHLGRFQRESDKDYDLAEEMLSRTGTSHLANRSFRQLSGGEQQLVAIARALAQEPRILLLDEPTSHLDVNHQIDIMDVVRQLNRVQGLTVVSVLHDLNLAAMYCDEAVLVSQGRVEAHGLIADVFRQDLLEKVYGCHVAIRRHPVLDCPQVHLLPGYSEAI